jgi:hypothetical protein
VTSQQWETLLKTGVIPAGVTLVTLLALWRPWRRDGATRAWAIPVATAIGFLVGSVLIVGWSGSSDLRHVLWPVSPTKRMGLYGMIGLLGAFVVGWLPESRAVRWRVIRLLVMLSAVALPAAILLAPRVRLAWTPAQSAAIVGGIGVVGLIWWSAIGAAAVRRPNAALPLTLGALSAAGAAILFQAGSAMFAQQAVMLGMVLGVCGAGAMVRPGLVNTRAIGAVPAVLFGVLWSGAAAYADGHLPITSLILMGIAPLSTWVVLAPGIRRRPGWLAGLVQIVLGVAVMGGAGAIATLATPQDQPESELSAPPSGDWDALIEDEDSKQPSVPPPDERPTQVP